MITKLLVEVGRQKPNAAGSGRREATAAGRGTLRSHCFWTGGKEPLLLDGTA